MTTKTRNAMISPHIRLEVISGWVTAAGLGGSGVGVGRRVAVGTGVNVGGEVGAAVS